MKKTLVTLSLALAAIFIHAQDINYKLLKDVPYYAEQGDEYRNERCRLDLYYPAGLNDYATLVWFHGGGLTGGNKYIPKELMEKGIAIVAVNYRLSPAVKSINCIEDAAAATAWVFNNIKDYGGNPELIFVSGHSAGGYLTSMVGLDKKYLAEFGIDCDNIAGLIPLSGHTITHMTVRSEMGIPNTRPVVDEMAPLFHVRPDAPPMLLITGDREMEMLGRYEENAYFWRMMKVAGHKDTRLFELDGYGHGMVFPACPLLINEIQRISKLKKGE